jgi:two-component system nitrate/nitrite response regulator NarL
MLTVMSAPRNRSSAAHLRALSESEIKTLRGLVRGDSNREIARRCGVKEQTIKNRVSGLIQKFGLRNRVELAVMVAREMPEFME